jgi:hypothetical protein
MDDIFHSCALRAYVDEAIIAQGWPDSDKVKARAYRYYENIIRKKP